MADRRRASRRASARSRSMISRSVVVQVTVDGEAMQEAYPKSAIADVRSCVLEAADRPVARGADGIRLDSTRACRGPDASPTVAGRRPSLDARGGPAARAVAGDEHRPPRQQGAHDAVRREGRRPPGVVGVDGQHHDGAVVRPPARARPRVGQAARRAGAARDQLPARPARPRVPDAAARVRRAAELPEPRARTRTRSTSRPARSASARRRRSGARSPTATSPGTSTCRRGGRQIALLGDAELDEGAIWEALVDPMVAAPRRGAVDRRPQPPVARPRRARHRRRPHRARCSRPPAGRRSPSSTAAGCASCSSARAARRCARASTR